MHPELEDWLLEHMASEERKRKMEKLPPPRLENALLTIPLASAKGLHRYEQLLTKHGTLAEFTTAVKRTLGECSVDEIDAAILKYRQELLEALAADMKDAGPEATCRRCFSPNVIWHAPNELWNRVMRKDGEGSEPYGGIVCPTCFIRLAVMDGVDAIWQLQPVDYKPEEKKDG